MANGFFEVGEDILFDRGCGSDPWMPIWSAWDFFLSFFLYVFKKKTRWPMFFLLTCERVGNNLGRQSNRRVLVPLDVGHFPLYLWTLVFSNSHFSKISVPQQWKPLVLLRPICTFLHTWCLWAVILCGSFTCNKMSRCNSEFYTYCQYSRQKKHY